MQVAIETTLNQLIVSATYVLAQQGKPGDLQAPKKFYAQVKARKELTFRELSKEISEGSTTVSDADVMTVLNDLIKEGAEATP